MSFFIKVCRALQKISEITFWYVFMAHSVYINRIRIDYIKQLETDNEIFWSKQ